MLSSQKWQPFRTASSRVELAPPRPRDAFDVRQVVAGRHMAWAAYAILHHKLVNHEDRREPYERVY
jgi:hypothetical protein